jgi:hypothetical protein
VLRARLDTLPALRYCSTHCYWLLLLLRILLLLASAYCYWLRLRLLLLPLMWPRCMATATATATATNVASLQVRNLAGFTCYEGLDTRRTATSLAATPPAPSAGKECARRMLTYADV